MKKMIYNTCCWRLACVLGMSRHLAIKARVPAGSLLPKVGRRGPLHVYHIEMVSPGPPSLHM